MPERTALAALSLSDGIASGVEMLPAAHFIVGMAQPAAALAQSLAHAYPGADIRTLAAMDATVTVAERAGRRILTHICLQRTGWLVLKGTIHDMRTDRAADAATLLAALAADQPDFARFEGEFALVVHDARRSVTWAFNDVASLLHLYYGEHGGAVYFTTAPLATARALGIGLDAAGVREFLGRGQVMCPRSLFAGMRRLGVGEHLRFGDGQIRIGRHWSPYHEPRRYRSRRTAAAVTADVLLSVAGRYARRGPIVSDLSGGYDSRLVASALSRAGARLTVTVNGHPQHPDVVLAKRVAQAAGWPIRHFAGIVDAEVTSAFRREAVYLSRGELDSLSFCNHLRTRPILGRDHVAHVNGSGGELLRDFPWGQEFAGIGQRRPASVERAVRYRLLSHRTLPDALFAAPFQELLYADVCARALAIIEDGAGTLTTQQLDAVYLLRLTGHIGGYNSSLFDLLPTCVPLMQRTMIEHAVSLPWPMRLSAGLLRRTIALLHPRAAGVETTYGSTAAPPTLATLPMEARQALGRIRHLADKIDRMALGGQLGRIVPLRERQDPAAPEPPFRTAEFRAFLDPARMHSRGLYRPRSIATLLGDPAAPIAAVSRIATLEHVCVEIGAEPGPELLTG